MKFFEIIKRAEWLSVEMVLLKLYPDEKKNLSGYKEVFNKLKIMPIKESNISILVSNEIDDFDNIEYVNVSGYYTNPKDNIDEQELSLAIEFTHWNEWLGMDVSPKTLSDFNELEIIAHCLYEMTFVGYEEKEIQAELDRINESVEEIKSMTDEEKNEKLLSWEDLKKEFEKEEDSDEDE
jgi:hypothetical protein